MRTADPSKRYNLGPRRDGARGRRRAWRRWRRVRRRRRRHEHDGRRARHEARPERHAGRHRRERRQVGLSLGHAQSGSELEYAGAAAVGGQARLRERHSATACSTARRTRTTSSSRALDDDYSAYIYTHESPTVIQDAWLRDAKAGTSTQLTHAKDVAPEVSGALHKRIQVTRPRDGMKFWVDLTLPADWKPGTRLPGIIWFYPREYSTPADYERSTVRARTSTVSRTRRRCGRRRRRNCG